MTSLPQPSEAQSGHSARLMTVICDEIAAAGGWMSFARYMELALYAPGLGYYSAGSTKFGGAGDFVTAPEISSLFARTLARQVADVLRETGGSVLELGPGTGRLAIGMLRELQQLDMLPERYCLLEVSAHLREVQREAMAAALPAALMEKVVWLDSLPDTFTGAIFGNEVLDALPVHVVAWHGRAIRERGVAVEDGRFVWRERLLPPGALRDAAERLALPAGYVSEISLTGPALVASLAQILEKGLLLVVDYGFSQREYYHPQRAMGTLMCHYRQQAHADPLILPGLQDITAHVDFTAVAAAGVARGLDLLGYAGQAQFLINCGITDLLAGVPAADAAAYLPLAAQAQKLLSPAEMGELFKVVALGREIEAPLRGFYRGDRRHAL